MRYDSLFPQVKSIPDPLELAQLFARKRPYVLDSMRNIAIAVGELGLKTDLSCEFSIFSPGGYNEGRIADGYLDLHSVTSFARQAFVGAHEIGHLILWQLRSQLALRREQQFDDWQTVGENFFRSEKEEQFINNFAKTLSLIVQGPIPSNRRFEQVNRELLASPYEIIKSFVSGHNEIDTYDLVTSLDYKLTDQVIMVFEREPQEQFPNLKFATRLRPALWSGTDLKSIYACSVNPPQDEFTAAESFLNALQESYYRDGNEKNGGLSKLILNANQVNYGYPQAGTFNNETLLVDGKIIDLVTFLPKNDRAPHESLQTQ